MSSLTDDGDTSYQSEVFTDRSLPGQSTATTLEAIRNMSRIQTKIMSLQGEALRVTYAIDRVNQCMVEWSQHKEDLKRAVERRAAQFQFYIKRMEHQLITQIDSKVNDDRFYAESDKSKNDLRKNLRNILHEVGVLKCLQEFGKDAEINLLGASVLGKSVGMSDVVLKKLHYDMEVPVKSIEEIVHECFGHINLISHDSTVFSPEVLDFTNISVGSGTETAIREEMTSGTDLEKNESITEEDVEEAFRRSRKKSNERRSRRHNTDLGLDSADVQEYLAQFQNARETFRNRRREILRQGQQAREDASPMRQDPRARPRSNSRNGRVQSLDRSAMPMTSTRGRSLIPSRSSGQQAAVEEDTDIVQYHYGAAAGQHKPVIRPEDISLPSPVIEEASVPSSPVKRLVKQVSDPRHSHEMTSQAESEGLDTASPLQDQHGRLATMGSFSPARRHSSEHVSPLTSLGYVPIDILDRNSSRPVRRAISSACDRRSKIEFLRENWQRRKEILIQNEGFVSPESQQAKVAVRAVIKSPPLSPKVLTSVPEKSESSVLDTGKDQIPLSSEEDAKGGGTMQQLRSRLSHFRHIIKGNGKNKVDAEREDLEEVNSVHSDKIGVNSTTSAQRSAGITSPTAGITSPSFRKSPTPISPAEPLSPTTTSKEGAQSPTPISKPEDTSPAPVITETPKPVYFKSRLTPATTAGPTSQAQAVVSSSAPEPFKPVFFKSRLTSTAPTPTVPTAASAAVDTPLADSTPTTTPEPPKPIYFKSRLTPTNTPVLTPKAPNDTTETQPAGSESPSKTAEQPKQVFFKSRLTPTTTAGPAAPPTSTAATSSRYSPKTYTKPTESMDVAAMIAAMYSGKEKTIIKTTSDQGAGPTTTVSSATAASTTITTTTTAPNARFYDSYSNRISATGSSAAATTASTSTTTVASGVMASTTATAATTAPSSSFSSLRTHTTTVTTTAAVTAPAVSYPTASSSTASSSTEPSKSSTTQASTSQPSVYRSHETSGPAPSVSVPTVNVPASSDQADNIRTFSGESPMTTQPSNDHYFKYESRRSRYSSSGFNRRHTIEVGKQDVKDAFASLSSMQQTPQGTASTNKRDNSRLLGFRDIESAQTLLPPLTEVDQPEELTSVTYQMGQKPILAKVVPSPLNLDPLQEGAILESQSPKRQGSAIAAAVAATLRSPSPSLSPTSPNAMDMGMKGKLREIARKKKERWRHLTIT